MMDEDRWIVMRGDGGWTQSVATEKDGRGVIRDLIRRFPTHIFALAEIKFIFETIIPEPTERALEPIKPEKA